MSKRESVITNQDIISEALSWLGTPYQHQACCKGAGCDCLGLIRGVYRHFWGEPESPPPYSPDWAEANGKETLALAAKRHLQPIEPQERQAGHVLLFRWRAQYPAKHAAILLPENRMIHAQNGSAVTIASLSDWWQRRIAYCFAFPLSQQPLINHEGGRS